MYVEKNKIRRVAYIGSCQTIHPQGIFFESEIRRPDGSLRCDKKIARRNVPAVL